MDEMLETMYEYPGIGLAAVQVGILKRLISLMFQKIKKKDPLFIINPEITFDRIINQLMKRAACLPGHFAEVERPAECHLNFVDYNGNKKDIKATGLLATCIQHEIDHLDGILFIDHISKLKRDMIIKKLKKSKKELDKVIL